MSDERINESRMTLYADFVGVDVRSAKNERGEWFLLDADDLSAADIERLAIDNDAVEVCRRHRAITAVFVTINDGRAVQVDAWRGLFSQADIYYSARSNGDFVLSDHLRNVMARLPVADRYPSDRGVAEHHLFRRLPGKCTISRAISRLGHAEHLCVDLGNGASSATIFDRFTSESVERSKEEYVDLIEAEFDKAITASLGNERPAVLFSGGVDSALISAFLGGRADAVTFVPDTAEFNPETEYARKAASLLGIEMMETHVPESDFVDMMERVTEMMATPSFDDSVPYFARLMESQPHSTFIAGQGADSAFGMSLKIARFASWFRWPGVSHGLNAASKIFPGHLGYRLRQVAPLAERFSKSALDPHGFAGAYRTFNSTPLLRNVIGPEVATAAQTDNLEYVMDRVEMVAGDGGQLLSHIEIAHWSSILANPMMPSHAVAKALGKRVRGPFLVPDLLNALASVPVSHRYIQGLTAKWILKDLLARRVPDYPANQRKKSTALPWERFYEDGPLTKVWEKYEVPSMFEGEARDEILSKPSKTTWTAISYAIWVETVARNTGLAPIEPAAGAAYPIGS